MSILIVGAGICGLGTGLLLARDGHDVTILEYVGTITLVQQLLARPDVAQGIRAARAAMKNGPSRRLPGPDRRQLLDLLS